MITENSNHKRKTPKEFAEAQAVMFDCLMDDDGLYAIYKSKIAMFLRDKCGIKDEMAQTLLRIDLIELMFCSK